MQSNVTTLAGCLKRPRDSLRFVIHSDREDVGVNRGSDGQTGELFSYVDLRLGFGAIICCAVFGQL